MSTKIYNGYRLKGNPSLLEVHEFCLKLKNKIKPLAEKTFKRHLINEMMDVYDKNQFGIYDQAMYFVNKESNSLFWGIDKFLRSKMDHIKVSQHRDPAYDYEFSISIHPHKNGSTLLMLFTERSELTKAFNKMKEVEEYHYQDQSDKPKNISDKKWEKRGNEWNDVLDGNGYGIPSECGFIYTPYSDVSRCIFGLDKKEKNKLIKLVVSVDERARVIAGNLMAKTWEETKLYPDLSTTDNYWKYLDFKKSDEGKKILNEKIEMIKPQLKIFNDISNFDTKITFHPHIQKIFKDDAGGKPYWYSKDK